MPIPPGEPRNVRPQNLLVSHSGQTYPTAIILANPVPQIHFIVEEKMRPGTIKPPSHGPTIVTTAPATRPSWRCPPAVPVETQKGKSWYTKRPEPLKPGERPLPPLPPPVAAPQTQVLVKQPVSRVDDGMREVLEFYADVLKDIEKGHLERVVHKSKGFGMLVLDAVRNSEEVSRTVRPPALLLAAKQAFLLSKDVFVNFGAHMPDMWKARGRKPPRNQDLKLIGYLLLEMTMSHVRDLAKTSDAEQAYLESTLLKPAGPPVTGVNDGSGISSTVSRDFSRVPLIQFRSYSESAMLFESTRTKNTDPGLASVCTFGTFYVLSFPCTA